MRLIRGLAAAAVALGLVVVGPARGQGQGPGPAEELLRLAPADAGVTLAVEDLRGHARAFLDSPLADGLGRLPAVRAWRDSDGRRNFERARRDIEAALKVDAARLRDDLLGDAVVLALHVAPGDPPDQGHGLLLARVRDRDLLLRLIREVNEAERRGGVLVDVAERQDGPQGYWVRTFRPGSKPTEYYAVLGEVFAWSNSEVLIRGAIERQGRGGGLGDEPRFRKVRRGLPARSAASLFVDPRFLERAIGADSRPRKPADERARALLLRYLAAVEYAGAAVQWRDGLILHIREAIDPTKLDEPVRRWAALSAGSTPPARRAPASALAVAAGPVDFAALFDGAMALVPESDRPRAEHLLAVLRGVLLGKEVRAEVLPRLGPGVLLYVDAPAGSGSEVRLPWVAAVEIGGDGVPAALENALRTALSLHALGPDGKAGASRVESRAVGEARVTSLSGARFAYAVEGRRLVLGSSPEAVAAHLAAGPRSGATGPRWLDRLRAAYFPEAATFAALDLDAAYRAADARRDALARGLAARRGAPVADARRDLDQALDLLHLFRAAFATSAIGPEFTTVHRTLGLIAREPVPAP